MAKKQIMYLGTLDKFGYDLTVIGNSEEEVVTALMKECEKHYKNIHGVSPKKDRYYGVSAIDPKDTFYSKAKEDIEIQELTVGQVEWR